MCRIIVGIPFSGDFGIWTRDLLVIGLNIFSLVIVNMVTKSGPGLFRRAGLWRTWLQWLEGLEWGLRAWGKRSAGALGRSGSEVRVALQGSGKSSVVSAGRPHCTWRDLGENWWFSFGFVPPSSALGAYGGLLNRSRIHVHELNFFFVTVVLDF